MRYAAKRDTNEAEIVAVLEKIGATVERLNDAALPDLLVGFRGTNFLLEVKVPQTGRLTEVQKAWWQNVWWSGQRAIVTTTEEALREIGAIK